jgi:outer membrane protein assembly factor BamB
MKTSLRLWPGVVAVVIQWLGWFVIPVVAPDIAMYGLFTGFGMGLVILLWWLFFSRAPWLERVAAIAVMPVAVLAIKPLVHQSIENGFMGNMVFIFSIPFMSLALVSWAATTRRLAKPARLVLLFPAMFLTCGALALIRTGGITGDSRSDFHWRWTPTPEERLLAQAASEPLAAPPAPAAPPATAPVAAPPVEPAAPAATPTAAKAPEITAAAAAPIPEPPAIWPGFRGPNRDSILRGVEIETDWSKLPPVELWRQPIGPAWSSFAVRGNLIYTQEQRGEDEDVSCYNLTTGKVVWRHKDAVRFYESNGGPGPRATPTISNGRVYTHGATGIVNALDANTGALLWSRNSSTDTGAPLPGWGFTSSPLLMKDQVIVAASGRLVAYDIATGTPRWSRKTGGGGYSSPHLMTIDGVDQIVLQHGAGAMSVAPADGAVLWQHTWETGVAIVQPVLAARDAVVIVGGDAMGGRGMRRLAISYGDGGWHAEERWTSTGLKPYFNDFVIHKGHAYGFDNSILSCINLEDGARKWKGGRYGHGQMLLLPDQDLLLVLSEDGDLALVKATPDQFTEVAKFKAIEGKTWNHPALAGDVLLVRNGEEMAAFRLSLVGHDTTR